MSVHATDLIEALHRLQRRHGWVPAGELQRLAQQLQVPASRAFGVASFYHLFDLQPPPAHRLGVCLGTACWLRGGAALRRILAARLDGAPGWQLLELGCVGGCAGAPLLLCDGRPLLRVPLDDAAALQRWLDQHGLPSGAVGG